MHWLCTNNRKSAAFKVCVQTAKYNGNYGSIEVEHRYWLENIKEEEAGSNKSATEKEKKTKYGTKEILRDIFTTRCLRKHVLIMVGTWFTVAMAYYGILFLAPSLAENFHLNFILGGLSEILVTVCIYFSLFLGRTISTMLCLCVNGILIIAIGVCSSYEAGVIVQTTVTLLARGIASALFYANLIQSNELFPTITRGCAFGICGVAGKCGNILSPFILMMAKHTSPILPMTILGIFCIISGLAQYFLPETLNILTPNSVADAQGMWE